MEKNKVLLTDKVTKENIKSPTFKKWVMRVLCFACILSLALQLAMCVVPISASAEENNSIVGTWIFKDGVTPFGVANSSLDFPRNYTILVDFTVTRDDGVVITMEKMKCYQSGSNFDFAYGTGKDTSWSGIRYTDGVWDENSIYRTVTITNPIVTDYSGQIDLTARYYTWLSSNAVRYVETVYDFTGEYRLFKPTLDIGFASTPTYQSYQFNYNIYGGYNADYMVFSSDADEVKLSYSFTDEESGGLRLMYRQMYDDDSGTWLVPRARIIHFQSNPDDPTFQQWLLDNTILIAPDSIDAIYDFGYEQGYNDGWTNNVIGDTLNAPLQALNNMVLLQTTDVTVTVGGVIVAMISLSILIVFLKKYAGG